MSDKIDKSLILLILIGFTFSDSLMGIIWDMGKSLIYLIIFIFGIGMVNSSFADNIKSIITELLNIGSNNFIKDSAATVAASTMGLIKSTIPNFFKSNNTINNNRSLNGNPTNNRSLL